MHFTKTLISLMLVGFTATATAATTDIGELGTFGGPVAINGIFGPNAVINDTYIFDLPFIASSVVGTAVSLSFDIPNFPGPELGIQNFTISLLDSVNTLIATDTQSGANDNLVTLTATLHTGFDYQFLVTGTVNGSFGGSYAGLLAAVPIPEADTYAMMLAGLGLIGFMVSRRRHS